MLLLPDVTLIAVSSVELESTLLALSISSHEIQFGATKLITSEHIHSRLPSLEVVKIPPIGILGYNKFMIESLHEYVDTNFCLVIQADGFVLNASRWNPEFLNYDYSGAPWCQNLPLKRSDIGLSYIDMGKNCVGNGGFSLRSKKLLLEVSKIKYEPHRYIPEAEDMVICHHHFDQLVDAGIKFAPPTLAASFSVETEEASYGYSPTSSFGFHGKKLRDSIFSNIQQ
jgi:hypothetical protein